MDVLPWNSSRMGYLAMHFGSGSDSCFLDGWGNYGPTHDGHSTRPHPGTMLFSDHLRGRDRTILYFIVI